MGYRRRRRSDASIILSETNYVASRLPWWGALVLGSALYITFSFLTPIWLESKLFEGRESIVYPFVEAIAQRHIDKFNWLGIACELIGVYYAARNYVYGLSASRSERNLVGFLARCFARNLD